MYTDTNEDDSSYYRCHYYYRCCVWLLLNAPFVFVVVYLVVLFAFIAFSRLETCPGKTLLAVGNYLVACQALFGIITGKQRGRTGIACFCLCWVAWTQSAVDDLIAAVCTNIVVLIQEEAIITFGAYCIIVITLYTVFGSARNYIDDLPAVG